MQNYDSRLLLTAKQRLVNKNAKRARTRSTWRSHQGLHRNQNNYGSKSENTPKPKKKGLTEKNKKEKGVLKQSGVITQTHKQKRKIQD